MINIKKDGSYYTEKFIADFIVSHIFSKIKFNSDITILEPSVGDGVFLKVLKNKLNSTHKKIDIYSIEKNKRELNKAVLNSEGLKNKSIHFKFLHGDFLKISNNLPVLFNIILGNPPYISKKFLSIKQISECKKIHNSIGLEESSIKNIWSAFLLKSSQLLKDDGIIAFILPSEILQVNFTKEIRQFLVTNFERIEVFTFNELLFENIGQATILLFLYRKASHKGQYYVSINKRDELITGNFKLGVNPTLITSNTKWTHHSLTGDELDLLYRLYNNLKTTKDYCKSRPGIVTAANNYFIIDREKEKKYDLSLYTKSIIQKGRFTNGKATFDKADLQRLQQEKRPTRLICFNDKVNIQNSKTRDYLNLGKELGIDERFKCSVRKKWYIVPNIIAPADGFFFKRSHLYPKLIVNRAKVLVTDSAYVIDVFSEYTIESFVYSFYNSLTLVFAELEGRYYGEGVLELTPNEFKKLPIPYIYLDNETFDTFAIKFANKNNIEEILINNDQTILSQNFKIQDEILDKIRVIRKKLVTKRMHGRF